MHRLPWHRHVLNATIDRMHTLAEILGEKSGDVIRIGGDATVYEALQASA